MAQACVRKVDGCCQEGLAHSHMATVEWGVGLRLQPYHSEFTVFGFWLAKQVTSTDTLAAVRSCQIPASSPE